MEQLAFWRGRTVSLKPRTKRKSRRYRLLDRNLKSGIRITFRIAPVEAKQLAAKAREEGLSLSELVRDSLFEMHNIGELGEEYATPDALARLALIRWLTLKAEAGVSFNGVDLSRELRNAVGLLRAH